jgi:c-di-GMP-binding flagellar brake protein YcgR
MEDDVLGVERRRFVRVDKEVPVKFRVLDQNNNQLLDWMNAKSKNISMGGVAIEITGLEVSSQKIAKSMDNIIELELMFHLGTENLKAHAKVVSVISKGKVKWNLSYKEVLEIGVKFTDVTPEKQQKIREFLIDSYLGKYGQE